MTWPHSKGARWGSDTLLVLQVALALTLMIGAALMARTYRNLSQVELIAIRLALGATRMEVIRLATAGSMRAVFVGSALGLLLSHLATQSLGRLLFGVTTHDPYVLVAVAATLTICAALLAARQGASVEPAVALRSDP